VRFNGFDLNELRLLIKCVVVGGEEEKELWRAGNGN
jgi:hypothetical protein